MIASLRMQFEDDDGRMMEIERQTDGGLRFTIIESGESSAFVIPADASVMFVNRLGAM